MNRITCFINWLIVGLFCFASAFAMWPLHNHTVQYQIEKFEGKRLPALSETLVNNLWFLWVVLLFWGIVTVVFVLKPTDAKTRLHTSASVFFGLFVLLVYLLAGIMPYIDIYVGLGR